MLQHDSSGCGLRLTGGTRKLDHRKGVPLLARMQGVDFHSLLRDKQWRGIAVGHGSTVNAENGLAIGSFTGPLTVGCPASVLPADSSYVLATGMAYSPMIRTGVTMKGTYAQAWMNALPNSSTGGKKRNLKLGN